MVLVGNFVVFVLRIQIGVNYSNSHFVLLLLVISIHYLRAVVMVMCLINLITEA